MSCCSPPSRKRARSETLSDDTDLRIGRHNSESIQTFLSTLRAVAPDVRTLSEPANIVPIVFPSLLRTCIPLATLPGHERSFSHLGRPVVQQIVEQVQRLPERHNRTLALLGTFGAGKSHLLAVIASMLFAEGKRVVFLPECSLLAEDPVFWLKLAFTLAFADVPQTMHRIMQFQSTFQVVQFARECRGDTYFLVDGLDQLGTDLKGVIANATSEHFLIYTAYAFDRSSSILRGAQCLRIPSGFTPDEFAHWRRHFDARLPTEVDKTHLRWLEDVSGRAPYFLLPLLELAGKKFSSITSIYRMGRHFETLTDQITQFNASAEKFSPSEKARFLQLMNACLTESTPEVRHGANTALYDPRYFYFDSEGQGHTLCGVVRDTMIDFFRAEDMTLFMRDAWYNAVRSDSPDLRQSAITQICLTRIGLSGLAHSDNTQPHAMRILTFRHPQTGPNFGWMFEHARAAPPGTMTSFLCIPGVEVCKFLSAVILRISPKDKMAQLIPVHISVTSTCVDLAAPFFAVVWHRWEAAIREEGFSVAHTYVSVDSLTEDSAEILKAGDDFRARVKFVSPPYTLRCLNVAQIDPKLGRILKPTKSLAPDLYSV